MVYGIVDRGNHDYYTHMSKVFQAMDHAQLQYNWLITDCVCYPQNKDIEKLLDQEYCWLSGEELSAIIAQEDFQWIWGCLCGFSKDITMEEVLSITPLPCFSMISAAMRVALNTPLTFRSITLSKVSSV